MGLKTNALQLERQVRSGRALQLAGDLVEELRMVDLLTDDEDSEAIGNIERLHATANQLAAAIKEKL